MGLDFMMHSIEDDWGVDDVVVSEMAAGRYSEGDALAWWLAMVRIAVPGSTFIDVGAYTGLYSLAAAAARLDTRTLAVEASVLTHGRLVQNTLLNRFDMRILPCHLAASDTREIVELGHGYGPLSMASGESLVPTYEIDHSELVPACSLDSLLFQEQTRPFGSVASRAMGVLPLSNVGGMKVDVEGVELSVLKGAQRLLQTFAPPLVIEILEGDRLTACEAFLTSCDYERLSVCPGENYIYSHRSQSELLRREHDQLCARAEPRCELSELLAYRV